jgi:type II secretory pathway predicted ATPase ExeA
MVETFFGFKKPPFGDSPDAKQLFASQSWTQVKARLQFLVDHHGAGLLTGEVGAGKSTAARTFTAGLNPNLYKILYLHWTCGSALDLLRQLALELDLVPAHYRGDLVRQISEAIVRLKQSKKQHPILICDEAQLLPHAALEQLPLLLNFDMDSSHYLTLLLVGQPLLRRTLSLQMHEPLRQRIAVQYHLEGLSRGTRCLPRSSAQSRRRLTALVRRYRPPSPISGHQRHPAQGQQTRHDRAAFGRRAQSRRGE